MAYSAEYVPAAVTQALRSSTNLAIFLRVGTTPPLHLYFGVDEIQAGFESIDSDGTVYQGGGRLQGIPNLEILLNGRSAAVNFTMSGIDPATGAMMLDSIPPVRGALVQMGLTTLDRYFQPVSKIIPIWTGIASHLEDAQAPVKEGDSPTVTLSLAVVGGENTRSRPSRSLWSDAMQRGAGVLSGKPLLVANWKDYPSGDPRQFQRDGGGGLIYDLVADTGNDWYSGVEAGVPVYFDAFCSRTGALARGVQPKWPVF